MGPTDHTCFNKSGTTTKRRSTLLRHYSRKCDDGRKKTSFKDAHTDIFSESTPAKSLDLSQLQEAPIATQLGSSVAASKAETSTIPYHINDVSIPHTINFQMHQKEMKPEKYNIPHRVLNINIALGRNKDRSMDIEKHKEKNKRKTMLLTKMQQIIMAQFDTKMIFIAIFGLLCLEASGTHVEKSFGEYLQKSLQHPSRLMRNKRDSHIASSEGTYFTAYDGVQDTNFPTPAVENVYKTWKPVSYGHPLKDATMFYAPPSLERVVIGGSLDVGTGNNIDRSDRGSQSRSLNGERRSIGDNNRKPPARPNVVIAAEPQRDFGSKGYSIYGSPDINYSKLYDQAPVKLQTHDSPKPNGREDPYLIFQRDMYNSANSSRAADDGKFEQQLLLSPQLAKLARKDPRFFNRNRPIIGPRIDLGGGGGGIKYMDPPNRKPNNYFYYSEDHPRYNKNAHLLKSPFAGEKTVKHPYSFDKGPGSSPKGIEIEIGEHRGNAGGIDRTEINVNPIQNDIDRLDIITAEDLVGRESVQSYSQVVPPPKSKQESSLINVYSFTNKHGQKENVGIIYDQSSLSSPQKNNIFDSQKDQIDYSGLDRSANGFQSIPFNRQQDNSPSFYQTPHSQAAVSSGSRAPHKSIPLNRRPVNAARKAYPLGNPRSTAVKSRPDFFKPQPRPPIYKIRPHKLEGVFGPALPPKPEPTRIRLPNDYSTDYRDQKREQIPPSPKQLEYIYGRNAYEGNIDYINKPPFRPQHRTNYQANRQPSRAVRRGDFGVTDRADVNSRDIVYKRIRDMDYSRPQVILHVKDSGELYVPDPLTEHMPMYDKNPRVEITPGHGTLNEYLARKEKEEEINRLDKLRQERLAIQRQKDLETQNRAEAERVRRSTTQITTTQTTTTFSPDAWLADFSDSMPHDMKDKSEAEFSNISPKKPRSVQGVRDILYHYQPLDLESEPSETVVFRDNDIHRNHFPNSSPSNGFKFPSTPEKQERRPSSVRQFRDVNKLSNKSNANSNRVRQSPIHHENEVPRIITHTKLVEQQPAASSKTPNYNVVIGLSYDDAGPKADTKDYDFEDTNDVAEASTEKEYSKGELYQICIFEVPEYLKTQLCGGILEGRSQQFINRRSDTGNNQQDVNFHLKNEEAEKLQHHEKEKAHVPLVSVVIPPRPSQLLHEKEIVQSISYNIVNTEDDSSLNNAAIGNKSPDELKKMKGIFLDRLITKNLELNQQHPPAVIITSNSKVKTYGPISSLSLDFSVPAPKLSRTQTVAPVLYRATTTATTQTPWKIVSLSTSTSPPVSPATYNTNTPTSSPIHFKPAKTVSPNARRRTVTIVPQNYSQPRRRPLRFRKRNKNTGVVQTSKPFEYFSRLAQHLGPRLKTPPPQYRRRSTTSSPSIVRQRVRQNK